MTVLSAILIGLATGALPSALITGFFMFRVNRAVALKTNAEADKAGAEASQIKSSTALSEAKAALELAAGRYATLDKDCKSCQRRLDGIRSAMEAVIEAVDAIMSRVTPSNGDEVQVTMTGPEIVKVRAAVRQARRHLG